MVLLVIKVAYPWPNCCICLTIVDFREVSNSQYVWSSFKDGLFLIMGDISSLHFTNKTDVQKSLCIASNYFHMFLVFLLLLGVHNEFFQVPKLGQPSFVLLYNEATVQSQALTRIIQLSFYKRLSTETEDNRGIFKLSNAAFAKFCHAKSSKRSLVSLSVVYSRCGGVHCSVW